MKRTTLVLMAITIIAKIIGFTREIFLSYYFGASFVTDAYLLSLTIPSTIFAFIGAGISTSFIPIFSEIKTKFKNRESNRFTSNVLNVVVIMSLIMTFSIMLFAEPIVRVFASGFSGDTLQLAVLFTRIGVISLSFSAMLFVFSGFLHVHEMFYATAFVAIPGSVLVILSIMFSVKFGSIYLSIGSTFSILLQLLILVPYIRKTGFKWSCTIDIKDKYLLRMLSLSLPVMIGVSVNQINILVDKTIASSISVGGISALAYANRLNLFIQGIFVMSIATIFYPRISKMVSVKDFDNLVKVLTRSINTILLLVLPLTVGFMVFSEEIVVVLFGRGQFDSVATAMTSSALFFYSIGMLAFGLREILSRVFYAFQDTRTPVINAMIGMGINIVLNLLLSRYLGIGGLAFATSISAIVTTLLLIFSLVRRVENVKRVNSLKTFIKILVSAGFMGIISRYSYNVLLNHYGTELSFIVMIFIAVIFYCILVFFMKIDEVNDFIVLIKGKLSKKNKKKMEI